MVVGPHTRRALHEIVDILCDALAADARVSEGLKPKRKPRGDRTYTMPENASDDVKRWAAGVLKATG